MVENIHGIQIGDLFYDSWGWEQTNIDFYEVVGLRGKATAVIRKIKNEYIGGYSWSGETKPVPGNYTGEPVSVRTRLCDCYNPARPQCNSPIRSGGRLNPTTADKAYTYSTYA